MEVPVCLEKRRVGILTVTPLGTDTVFRVRCTGLPAGLYRLYACGDGGELLLGVTEDGCLHRRFSAVMTAPLGAVTRCRAQPRRLRNGGRRRRRTACRGTSPPVRCCGGRAV